VRQQLEARMPDEEVARLLGIDLTHPTLLLRLLVSDSRGRPLEVADAFYRADRYRYELILPRVPRRVAARGDRRALAVEVRTPVTRPRTPSTRR
jgi:GntR family transcriptional regulator